MAKYSTIAYGRPDCILNLYMLYPAVLGDGVQKGRTDKGFIDVDGSA